MRIRKNRKLSLSHGLELGEAEIVYPHVCLLNQSPWDLIPFSQQDYQSAIRKFERENISDGNEGFDDSVVYTVKRENDESATKMKKNNKNTKKTPPKNKGKTVYFEQNNEIDTSEKKEEVEKCERKAKRAKSKSSNSHQFYYYSGFGPLWGKKKDRRGEQTKNKDSEYIKISQFHVC